MDKSSSVFRIRAHNSAGDSENKIHDDQTAASYGFRGGLVPGVTVYGYMVPAIIDCFGRSWIEHGSANIRFHAPCYDGETVIARCVESGVIAAHEDGSIYASGTVAESSSDPPSNYSLHPLPEKERRPAASSESIVPGLSLGSIREVIDVQVEAGIPERLLRMANEILVCNFRMSPWIHAGSQVRHHRATTIGEEIIVTGVVAECFERKGRSFAVADLAMSAKSGPVASVRHTFIYKM